MDRLKLIGWKRNKEYENAPATRLRLSFCDEPISCGGLRTNSATRMASQPDCEGKQLNVFPPRDIVTGMSAGPLFSPRR